jgi:endonuclease YncB( thermonuclease family)
MKYLKLVVLFLSITVYSQSGKVVRVKDGDTVVVLDSLNNQTTIRLAEVDCPESSQPFGKVAKVFTSGQVAMKNVTYEIVTKDQYGRTVAKVFYNGKYLSEEIIKNGMGWQYKRHSTSKKLAALEQLAKDNKIGLWSDKRAVAPWEYREMKKRNFRTF